MFLLYVQEKSYSSIYRTIENVNVLLHFNYKSGCFYILVLWASINIKEVFVLG